MPWLGWALTNPAFVLAATAAAVARAAALQPGGEILRPAVCCFFYFSHCWTEISKAFERAWSVAVKHFFLFFFTSKCHGGVAGAGGQTKSTPAAPRRFRVCLFGTCSSVTFGRRGTRRRRSGCDEGFVGLGAVLSMQQL